MRLYNSHWQARWDTATEGRFYHSVHPNITTKHGFSPLPRRNEIVYHRLLLGRAWLGSTKYRFKFTNSDLCDLCNVCDDVYHFMFTCNKYNKERKEFMEKIQPEDFTPTNVFKFDNLKYLIGFLRDTGGYDWL